MKDALIVSMLSVVPRRRAAWLMGWLARSGLSRLGVRLFAWAYGVDLSEASQPISAYRTLEDFFTRSLREGVRPIDATEDALVSPVDGRVAQVGTTTEGQIEVSPGQHLSIPELIGEDIDGERGVAVLYLSPKDYHRVHVPREGKVIRWRYAPGDLWPVFPAAVRRVSGLFSRNERLCLRFETATGLLDVVMVGAFGVGRISTEVADIVSNNGFDADERAVVPPAKMARGDLLGTFHLGSTVVLVAPDGAWEWTVSPGDTVKMGRRIAEQSAF